MLHQIIRYSVNEFAYNEGLIGRYTRFIISREDCTFFVKKKIYFNQFFYSHLVNNRRSTFYGNRMSRIQRTI